MPELAIPSALPQTATDAQKTEALDRAVDEAIALCDGDVRAALKSSIVCIQWLEARIAQMRTSASVGYMRGKQPKPPE
jgi:hypothetical protein